MATNDFSLFGYIINSTHIDTTGISIISQLHGGLEGERRLSATEGNQHSSVVALQVARIQEQILESCLKIQDRQTLIALTKEYVLNPTRGEQILKAFNEHPSATLETPTEWSALYSRQRLREDFKLAA